MADTRHNKLMGECRCLALCVLLTLLWSSATGAFQISRGGQPRAPQQQHEEPATWVMKATATPDADQTRDFRFSSPLLEQGYPPVVEEYEQGTLQEKPLLVYLPGFDGTWMAPFLQLPELSTAFDVRCLTISMKDRSTYEQLKLSVVDYIRSELKQREKDDEGPKRKFGLPNVLKGKPPGQTVYIAGESFGGILASDVALTLLEDGEYRDNLKGITLINAATCYDRSKLAAMGPMATSLPPWLYPLGLARLLPLFTDEHSFAQLLEILKANALPSVIDSTQRESFMGRVAFQIPKILQYMPQETLDWRLTEWLETGCEIMETRLEEFANHRGFRALIVAGEKDLCLPSIGEAERLASVFPKPQVFVVEGAGHASTCGSRVDLTALMRKRFTELKGRKEMKPTAAAGKGVNLGMEPRYDGRDDIGLSPLKYWSKQNYRKVDLKTSG